MIKYKHYQTCPTAMAGLDNVEEEPIIYFDTEAEAKSWAFDYISRFAGKEIYLRTIYIQKYQKCDDPNATYQVKIRISTKL